MTEQMDESSDLSPPPSSQIEEEPRVLQVDNETPAHDLDKQPTPSDVRANGQEKVPSPSATNVSGKDELPVSDGPMPLVISNDGNELAREKDLEGEDVPPSKGLDDTSHERQGSTRQDLMPGADLDTTSTAATEEPKSPGAAASEGMPDSSMFLLPGSRMFAYMFISTCPIV